MIGGSARMFLVCSVLGIAWDLTHAIMDLILAHSYRALVLGVPLAVVWGTLLAHSRRHCWALYGAIVCGALGCYWVASVHFPGSGRYGPFPWVVDPEGAGAAWELPYNLLLYGGLLLGLTIFWTGGRQGQGRRDPRLSTILFALLLGSTLIGASVGLTLYRAGDEFLVLAPRRLEWFVSIGVAPMVVLAAATMQLSVSTSVIRRNRDRSPPHEQDALERRQ